MVVDEEEVTTPKEKRGGGTGTLRKTMTPTRISNVTGQKGNNL